MPCYHLDVVGGDCEDVAAHVVEGVDPLEVEECLADALHLVEGKVVVDGHLPDELPLGRTQLLRGEWDIAQAAQFGKDEFGAAVGGAGVHARIDVEEARVGEGDILRLNGVAEALFFAHSDVETGVQGRTPDNVVEERKGGLLRVEKGRGGAADEEVHLMGVLVHRGVEWQGRGRNGLPDVWPFGCLDVRSAKVFLAEVDESGKVDIAHSADDHAVGGVVVAHEAAQHVGREVLDIALGAKDVVGEGMGAEDALLEVVVDEVGRGVAVEVDFLDDDIFLFLYFVFREGGMEEYVGEELEGALQML